MRTALLLLHGLAAVVWIGGMVFVTAVLLPAMRASTDPASHAPLLRAAIGRFRWLAGSAAALLFLTGLGLLPGAGLESAWRLALLLAMAVAWALLTGVVVSSRPPAGGSDADPERLRARLGAMIRMHWTLVGIAGVALGSGLVLGAT